MMISIDAEKALDKIEHPFFIKKKKTFNKSNIERMYLKAYIKSPQLTSYSVLKGGKLFF